MPKTRPEYLSGHFYHFFNRGAHRVSLFREHGNYIFVLRKVKKYVAAFDLTMVAYCLMPNHYHFLMRQDGDHAARLLPQRVFNSHSKAYKRYDHSGTLFEGNYKVEAVEDEVYMLQVCRYIHANPVKDGLVDKAAAWPYSDYLEWVGEREGTLVDRGLVMAYFASPTDYEAFVEEYLTARPEAGATHS
jgi:putative transposase